MKNQRHDWSLDEIRDLYHRPFLELVRLAQDVHAQNFTPGEVQVSSLISIKTGGCPEDCGYCPQAARYHTDIKKHPLMDKDEVLRLSREAKAKGASRVCLGAAWREVRDGRDFDAVVDIVRAVSAEGVQVCCTLGMLTEAQAARLKDAGLSAYNHNIDTSPAFYNEVIKTRTFDDRLGTIDNVRRAGISVCSGGILGLGESVDDRLLMLQTLSRLRPHPESVPINTLVPVKGTPLGDRETVETEDLVRAIATARILMPKSFIRLSAGRLGRSLAEQALCFLAGANSIFSGEKLLTTPNPEADVDERMFSTLGLVKLGLPSATEYV